MATKKIMIEVDTEELSASEELQSALIRLGGRKALDDAFDEETGYDYTSEEIENFSEQEYEAHRADIKRAVSEGKVK